MDRVVGIDVARGLAVLGMFVAHVGPSDPSFWTATGWLQIADGRSAAGFALLAGVSAALLSGGTVPRDPLTRDRARILTRAALIGALGILVIYLRTPVAVILPTYALLFAVVVLVLRWSRPALLAAAAVAVLAGPPLLMAARAAELGASSYPASLVVGDYYPALVWIAYVLVGLAVGRSDLGSRQVRRTLLLAGSLLTAVGYGVSAVALRTLDDPSARALLTAEPHADTAPEVLGNTGVVLLVLVGSLVVAERFPRAVVPVAATGALALTAYCTHLVAIALLGREVVYEAQLEILLAFLGVTLVLTTVWRLLWGRGPLERLVQVPSTWVGDQVAPRRSPAGLPG